MATVNSSSDYEEDPHLGGYITGSNDGGKSHVECNCDAGDSLKDIREAVDEIGRKELEEAQKGQVNDGAGRPKPSRKKCELCIGTESLNHYITNCYAFLGKTPNERKVFAEALDLCLNCLQRGHNLVDCELEDPCSVSHCGQTHHTILHEAFVPKPRFIPKYASQFMEEFPVRLELVPLTVRHADSCVVVNTYAWLGGPVNKTICSERLLRKLKVNPPRKVKHVQTANGTNKRNGHVVTLLLQGLNMKERFEVEGVYSSPTMNVMDDHILDNKTAKYYSDMFGIELPVLEHTDMDLLLGLDVLGQYPRSYGNTAFPGCPNVSLTPLGWLVHGEDRLMKATKFRFISYHWITDCTQSECCQEKDDGPPDLLIPHMMC